MRLEHLLSGIQFRLETDTLVLETFFLARGKRFKKRSAINYDYSKIFIGLEERTGLVAQVVRALH